MYFSMTRNTDYLQIFWIIVLSIFIFMMNFEFTFFLFATIAFMWKQRESKISITGNSRSVGRMIFPYCIKTDFRIETTDFKISTMIRAMNSLRFIRTNKELFITFRAYFRDFISCVIFVKTCFTAKNVSVIKTVDCERQPTFFADFWFSDFCTRFRITCFRAINLSLVISRNFLVTLFAVHAFQSIRSSLTSQSYRRIYG